ncbi:MAG TPA: hypothetical protein VHR65_00260 [Solirubrobacterales bacterium]|nr:hypothetical protein [Solirubrobacterales bacterium]
MSVLLGAAKWARRVDGAPRSSARPRRCPVWRPSPRYAVCARERVDNAGDVLAHAADIF